MTDTTREKILDFGYTVPAGVKTAWGARLIVNQDGHVDMLWDRTDAVGPDDERHALLDYLNGIGFVWKNALSLKLRDREVDTRKAEEVVLFDDGTVRIEGNSNASAGYFYVVAYFTDAEGGEAPVS